MIRLNIHYPNTPGSHFNLDYYLGTQMPMTKRLFGDVLKEITLEHGMAGVEPDSPPTYIMSCHRKEMGVKSWCARRSLGAWDGHSGRVA